MRIQVGLILGLGGILVVSAARATTFVLADPSQLSDVSEGIIVGQVTSLSTVESGGQLRTNVELAVEQSLKAAYGPVVTVVEPGGQVGGRQSWITGAPQFFVGERALLFLQRGADGLLHTTYLGMGKFHVVRSIDGSELAVRSLADVRLLERRSGKLQDGPQTATYVLAELLQTLRSHIGSGGGGATLPAPSAVSGSRWQAHFTFSGPPALRWFDSDDGNPVIYHVDANGAARLGDESSSAAADAALAAWEAPACTDLELSRGEAAVQAPFGACDGRSQILFNDPFGEVADPIDCVGVLAIGGVCADATDPRQFNGGSFYQITEGDVVVNDGFEGCAFWNATNLAEVLTHELGHSLGLGHSSDDPNEVDLVLHQATMYFAAHFDGRGARLMADDQAAVCAIYPSGRSGTLRLRQFALIFDVASRPQRDRLVIDGVLQLFDQPFDSATDTLILSARVAGISLLRLAVPPGHWRTNPAGKRLRYRIEDGHRSMTLTLSDQGAGLSTVRLRASGLDLSMARTDSVTLSLAAGNASVTKAVTLRTASRLRLFP
jgi:hypothetical protein